MLKGNKSSTFGYYLIGWESSILGGSESTRAGYDLNDTSY